MSPRFSLRRSPKPGALTPTTLIVPRSLLTASVASASPSTSSAMIRRFLLTWSSFSSTGRMSVTARDLLVGDQDVRVVELRFHLLGVGDEVGGDVAAVELPCPRRTRPRCVMPFDSSTVTTPSLPTFSITSPMSSPIVGVGGGDGGDLRDLLARR